MKTDVMSNLHELSPEEANFVLISIRNKDIKLKFKNEGSNKIESAQITASALPKKYFLLVSPHFTHADNPVTFKIQLGTDVYFFKTVINSDGKYFFINLPFSIFKLIRRDKRRFAIPSAWLQTGSIMLIDKNLYTSKVHWIDLSLSGIKVLVVGDLTAFEKMQQVKINFKIHRRSEIQVFGFIRHITKQKSKDQILGIQFVNESKLIQNKIQNLCDDLAHVAM